MTPNQSLQAHLKSVIERRFRRWKVSALRDGGFNIEAVAYRVRVPAREYAIGWGVDIGVNETGELVIQKEYGWNSPALFKNEGRQDWAVENPPEQLKRKAWAPALKKAKERLLQTSEFDVQLPNGLLARWSPWTDTLVGWGEVPKKGRENRLKRDHLSWSDFLAEQVVRHGETIRPHWQKKLLLLRDPHPTVVAKYETEATKAYRTERQERIKQARAAKEGRQTT
jgi:hypothetical protein